MYRNTIVDTVGLADADIFITIQHYTPQGGFVTGVKNKERLGDSMRVIDSSNGQKFLHSLHMHRLALDGSNCEPFEYLFVGYQGSKANADFEEEKFRIECQAKGMLEIMQTRFENQETK